MPAVRIEDLTIEYVQGGYSVRPVDGLSAESSDGELVLLLGPSGCGKTTVLSCRAALPDARRGRVTVGETDVTELKGTALAEYRRHGVGIAFQAFNLIPSLTARENVAAPLRLAGIGRRGANARAEELLERVGLKERIRHRPGQLSGGEQQRVAIAGAGPRRPADPGRRATRAPGLRAGGVRAGVDAMLTQDLDEVGGQRDRAGPVAGAPGAGP